MTDNSPADTLRRAADRLRDLATTASTDDDGTPTASWVVAHRSVQRPDGSYAHGRLYGGVTDAERSWTRLLHGSAGPGGRGSTPFMKTRHAEYAAAMGPVVGLALADWLDFEADLIDRVPGAELRDRTERALAVARAILAEKAQR